MILLEKKKEMRGKKFGIVKQSTEMTLYLYDIFTLISRKKNIIGFYSAVLHIILLVKIVLYVNIVEYFFLLFSL